MARTKPKLNRSHPKITSFWKSSASSCVVEPDLVVNELDTPELMDSDGEDSDSELHSKSTTHLNILQVECSYTGNESDQKHNSHASTPIAEIGQTSLHQQPLNWRDFAKLQLKYTKEMSVIY